MAYINVILFFHVFKYGEFTFKVYFTYEVNLEVNEKISVLQGGRKM